MLHSITMAMKVWIDADACPKIIKEFIFKAAFRHQVPVVLVANSSMFIPPSPLISLQIVGKSLDEADRYILEHATSGDLVVSADIPLVAALVSKGVLAINPRGEVYTEENAQEALAVRNLMQELRDGGLVQGGPSALGPKDLTLFANSFEKEMTKLMRRK